MRDGLLEPFPDLSVRVECPGGEDFSNAQLDHPPSPLSDTHRTHGGFILDSKDGHGLALDLLHSW